MFFFLITLREGAGSLPAGRHLPLLPRQAGASRYNKFIYLGVGLGLVASLVVAFPVPGGGESVRDANATTIC